MTMRTPLLIVAALLVAMVALGLPAASSAQQPKMDVKLFVGLSGTTFVEMLEEGRSRDTFAGWQIGFGPRIRRRVWFAEIQFSFNRWAFAFNEIIDPDTGNPIVDPETGNPISVTGRSNSFELPLIGGYVPYKNAFFKLYLYGGLVNHFNTKLIFKILGETVKLRPKEADFAIYQALARFGVNFDLAMFNFDFNYSISMNSATTTSYRTGYHQIQVNVAYLF
jgi:hypothetical protein